MFKHICIQKNIYLALPVVFLLLSACSSQEEAPADPTSLPTNTPIASATSAATDTPIPEPTAAPSEAPESTEAKPTMVEERPDITIALPDGDAERGRKLALKWRCFTCHVTNENGPRLGTTDELPAMLERAEMRIAEAGYAGFATTPMEYIVEAIIDPSVYLADGEWEYKMDEVYREELSDKDLADVVAWLVIFDEMEQ